jgi:hypothetical protein
LSQEVCKAGGVCGANDVEVPDGLSVAHDPRQPKISDPAKGRAIQRCRRPALRVPIV